METSIDLTKRYTYADYLTWIDDKARELINGIIKMMPSPLSEHARISRNLFRRLDAIVLENKGRCEVFYAPVDVRLTHTGETANDKIENVVQPDLFVVCDPSKIDRRGCCGAPDMIVEILSPNSLKRDAHEKFVLYQEAAVGEYWIVNPDAQTVNTFILNENGKYDDGKVYETQDKIPVHIFDNALIDVKDIFEGRKLLNK